MPPFLIPLAALTIGLDYLRRQLLPDAPESSPVGEPYTPPFSGGQCPVIYQFDVTFLDVASGNRSAVVNGSIQAPIKNISAFNDRNGTAGIDVEGANGTVTFSFGSNNFTRDYEVSNIRRADGLPDNCGDLPNPNPVPTVASDGVSSVAAPIYDGDTSIAAGSPIVPFNPVAAVLATIAAAVAAAGNALDAAKKIMDAIETIGRFLDELKDWLEDNLGDDDKKKSLFIHNYGSVRRDGFLRLYPTGEVEGFKPVYLDLQLLAIPVGYGKYFGNLSPNFYRFKSLGYISFVSPSFGILETRQIEFNRTSLNVPDNAYGFFYHLGLENQIRANVSLFYLKNV